MNTELLVPHACTTLRGMRYQETYSGKTIKDVNVTCLLNSKDLESLLIGFIEDTLSDACLSSLTMASYLFAV